MPEDAAFNEQIKLELDLGSFEGQLDQLARIWEDALSKMGESTPSLSNVLNLGEINGQLAELGESLKGFALAFDDNLKNVQTSFSEALSNAGKSIGEALAGQTKDAMSKAGKAAVDEVEQTVATIEERIKTITPKLDQGQKGVTLPQSYEVKEGVYKHINQKEQDSGFDGSYLAKLSEQYRKFYSDEQALRAKADMQWELSEQGRVKAAEEANAKIRESSIKTFPEGPFMVKPSQISGAGQPN